MSPSEDQLRAALRQGEGTRPNVDAIVRTAVRVQRERRERRVRAFSAVGAAVVVAGIAVGITAHSNRDTEKGAAAKGVAVPRAANHGAASNAAGGENTSNDYAATNGGVGGTASLPSALVPSTGICPATPVRYPLPNSGGTSEPIFARPVSSLTFCLYSADRKTYEGSRVLAGSAAKAFAADVESAKQADDPALCLSLSAIGEIVATDVDGNTLVPVSVVPGCDQAKLTNGTAVRYVPISALARASEGTSVAPSGGMSGSPPR